MPLAPPLERRPARGGLVDDAEHLLDVKGEASPPRTPGRLGCRSCGLSAGEHGVHLIHRFIDPDPPSAESPSRSRASSSSSIDREDSPSQAGRRRPDRGTLTAYLYALHAGEDGAQQLQRALAALPALIPGCQHAALIAGTPGAWHPAGAGDQSAARSQQRQLALDEGPTLQALRTSHTVWGHDLRLETRWPNWCSYATTELQLGAALAVPLHHQQRLVGALTVHADEPGALSDVDLLLLHTLAFPLARALIEMRLTRLTWR